MQHVFYESLFFSGFSCLSISRCSSSGKFTVAYYMKDIYTLSPQFCGTYFIQVGSARAVVFSSWHEQTFQSSAAIYPLPQAIYPSLPALAILDSMTLVLTDFMYKLDSSPSRHALNIVLFACGFILHTWIFFTRYVPGTMPGIPTLAVSRLAAIVLLCLEALRGLTSLSVIYRAYFSISSIQTL
jgi:hypothetical protein